jgi:hypothetical protein
LEQARHAHRQITRRDPLWPEQLTVLATILLGLLLPDALTVGPTWLLPACEGVMFVALVASTPPSPTRERPRRRHLRVTLVGLLSAGNAASLFLLARYLIVKSNADGRELLFGGVTLWVTGILLFALWYWEIDRGGPIRRGTPAEDRPDFAFPQMQEPSWGPPDWSPRLPDYLYMSLINAATFAPPESMPPLTGQAKLVMSLQTLASLVTIALVVARAVNILGGGVG